MDVVILGAGRIGQYVAGALSRENHSVTIIDQDHRRLEEVSQKMDVATKRGSCTDPRLLASLMEDQPSLVLALTDNDEANLIACDIVKHIANTRTIARLKNTAYCEEESIDIKRLFSVDHLVIPELLASDQVSKIILNQGYYAETFFHGAVLLRTFQIPHNWPFAGMPLAQLKQESKNCIFALISRPQEIQARPSLLKTLSSAYENRIIFPHGKDVILPGDEVTIIGEAESVIESYAFFRTPHLLPSSVVIAGGTPAAAYLANDLSRHNIHVRLIEQSASKGRLYAEKFGSFPILKQEGADWDFLAAERVDQAEVFVAYTPHEEKNVLLSLFAKQLGAKTVITCLSETASAKVVEQYGITRVISERISTCDRIMALSRAEKVLAALSLYDGRADVLEIKVSEDSPVTGIPLATLGPRLPKEVIFGIISSRGRIFVASGSHILCPNDHILVICDPQHKELLERLF